MLSAAYLGGRELSGGNDGDALISAAYLGGRHGGRKLSGGNDGGPALLNSRDEDVFVPGLVNQA